MTGGGHEPGFFLSLLALTVVVSAPLSIAGQAHAGWSPALGADGHPDLQGVWLNSSATPLERPPALAGKPTLTDDEVAELRRRADRLFKNTNADFPAGDAVFPRGARRYRSLQEHDRDRHDVRMIEREFDNRTSLIVDPPDGRIPSLTLEAQQRVAAGAPAVSVLPKGRRISRRSSDA